MDDMYKTCRWCKHYKNGCCTRDNFTVINKRSEDDINNRVRLEIKEPESFYCSNWE